MILGILLLTGLIVVDSVVFDRPIVGESGDKVVMVCKKQGQDTVCYE